MKLLPVGVGSADQKIGIRARIVTSLFAIIVVLLGFGPALVRALPSLAPLVENGPNAAVVLVALITFTQMRSENLVSTPLVKWFELFMLICVGSWIVTFWQYPALATYGIRAVVFGLLASFMLQRSYLPFSALSFLKNVVLLVILLNCLVALRQAIFGLSGTELDTLVNAGSSYQVGETTRLLGMMSTGQDLSVLTGAGVVWTLVAISRQGFRNAGILTILVALSSSIATFLILQRSAILGIACGVVVVTLPLARNAVLNGGKLKKSSFLILGTILVGGIIAFGIFIPDRMSIAVDRFQSLFGLGNDYSFNQRQETTLPVSLDLVRSNPFGYGIGASGPVGSQQAPVGPLANFDLGGLIADNGYIFMALQLGLLGAFVFLAMLVQWIRYGSFFVRTGSHFLAGSGVVGFLCGIMLSGTFWALTSPILIVLVLASIPLREFPSKPT